MTVRPVRRRWLLRNCALSAVTTSAAPAGVRRPQPGSPHQHEATGYRRGPAAMRRLSPVRGRRSPHAVGEPAAECAEAAEPDHHADLGDGEVYRAQQLACTLDPAAGQIPAWRLAVRRAEGPDELAERVPGVGRQIRDRDLLRVVAVHAVPRPPERAKAAHADDGRPAHSAKVATGEPSTSLRRASCAGPP